MSSVARAGEASEIGRGPLSRGAAFVYRLIVLEVLLLVASSPTIAVMLLLDRDASNLPLAVLALLPVAPALVAGVSAIRAWRKDDDLSPARPFVRAYVRDLGATLKWWVPALLVAAVLVFNLVHIGAVEGGAALRPVLFVIVTLIMIWCGHMVVLTAGFRFRTRDAARIAVAETFPQWRFSLGVLALLVVAAAVIVWSEILLLLLGWAFVGLLTIMAAPLITEVTERFTRHD